MGNVKEFKEINSHFLYIFGQIEMQLGLLCTAPLGILMSFQVHSKHSKAKKNNIYENDQERKHGSIKQ